MLKPLMAFAHCFFPRLAEVTGALVTSDDCTTASSFKLFGILGFHLILGCCCCCCCWVAAAAPSYDPVHSKKLTPSHFSLITRSVRENTYPPLLPAMADRLTKEHLKSGRILVQPRFISFSPGPQKGEVFTEQTSLTSMPIAHLAR